MHRVREYFKGDKLAEYLGIELVEVEKGRAKVRLQLRDCHYNAVGVAHGGTIFSLADFAFAVACNSHGTLAMAINVSITFIKAARAGSVLTAEAVEESVNPKLGLYRVTVTNEEGELIATFQGLAYRKPDKPLVPSP